MNLFSRHNAALLRRAGETWLAEIPNRDVLEFDAIFDQENRLEEDSSGLAVLITGSVITCLASVARQLKRGTKLHGPDDRIVYVRDVLFVDDGQMARVSVVTLKQDCE